MKIQNDCLNCSVGNNKTIKVIGNMKDPVCCECGKKIVDTPKTYLHPFQDELIYYPKKNGKECEFCGIVSFAHKHKAGTLPKDFERIPEASKTIEDTPKEAWEDRWYKLCESIESGKVHLESRYKGLGKAFISKELELAKREGAREVIEAISKLKIITPEREPPKNRLTQNQIFASGQMNMLLRVNDVLTTLREETVK